MSYRLPLQDDPLRLVFDIKDIVAIGTDPMQRARVASLPEARRSARRFLAKTPDASSIHVLCKTIHGDLVLMRVSREASNIAWVFGPLEQ